MRWREGRRSDNIEDRRGHSPRHGLGGGKLGLGGIALLVVVSLVTGQNPLELLGMLQGGAPAPSSTPVQHSAESEEQKAFVSSVLASTEDTWGALFAQQGGRYREPTLVLFSGAVESACGYAQSAMGPFYCPGDQKVYLDMDFFHELGQRLGAGGDFASAYVIGHEIGHHVQNLLGTAGKVHAAQQQSSPEDANRLSVLLELQADCYAGIWAHHADQQRALLEAGDIEEAMNAAAAIGDDRLQQMAGQAVNPEAFTHGSSRERMRWFDTGLREGELAACDTFRAPS